MNGPVFLGLASCMAWATSSFPVPLSPSISTLPRPFAALLAFSIASVNSPDRPMRLLKV